MTQEIEIRLFGAFRQVDAGGRIKVAVAEDARVADLRRALAERLQDDDNAISLLESSAFATDSAVLDEADALPGRELSILPPVCGG